MKKHNVLLTIALTGTALAQGPLTPGGSAQATMKTLHQVEPRTAFPPSPDAPNAGPHHTIGINPQPLPPRWQLIPLLASAVSEHLEPWGSVANLSEG